MSSTSRKRKKNAAPKQTAPAETVVGQAQAEAEHYDDWGSRVMYAAMHLLVFLVPVIFTTWLAKVFGSPVTAEQFDLPKLVAMQLLVLVGLGGWGWSFLSGKRPLRRGRGDWLILVVLLWILLATIFAIHHPTALVGKYRRFEGLVTFLFYGGLFFLGLQAVDGAARLRSLSRTLVLAGAVVGGYGLLQYVGLDPLTWTSISFDEQQSFSTMGNPNLLAGYLLFPLVIGVSLALSEERLGWRIVYWAAALLSGGALLTSFTRGAWIAAAVALVLLLGAAVWYRVRPTRVEAIAGAGGLVAFAALVVTNLAGRSGFTNFADRLTSLLDFSAGSSGSRLEIWRSAVAAIGDRPLFGFGPDTFRLIFPGYKTEQYVAIVGRSNVADNVHNYILQLAVTTGILGALIVFGFFAWVLYRAGRRLFSSRRGDRLLYAGYWIAVVAYLVHLVFGISVVGSTTLLWISLGLLLGFDGWSEEVRVPAGVRRLAPAAGSLVLIVVAAFSLSQLVADNLYVRALNPALQPERRVELLEEASSWNPFMEPYRSELGRAYGFQMERLILLAKNDSADQEEYFSAAREYYRGAEASFEDVIEFSPWEADNYLFLASTHNHAAIYFYPSAFEKAFAVAEEGIERAPRNADIRVEAGFAAMKTGRPERAMEHLSAALDIDPTYAEAAAVLGDAYVAAGELEQARDAYLRAAEIEPQNEAFQEAVRRVEEDMEQSAVEGSLG